MKEKKHIDELFKDGFKNFEASPSPEVWANIQAQLKKDKEDRKVIPLWWKLGGVAALLALLFTIGTQFLGPSHNQDNPISDEDITVPVETNNSDSNQILGESDSDTEIATEDDVDASGNKLIDNSSNETLLKNNGNETVLKKNNASENAIVVENKDKATVQKNESYKNLIVKDKGALKTTEKDAVANTTDKSTEALIKKEMGIAKGEETKIAKNTSEEKAVKDVSEKSINPILKKETKIGETKDEKIASEDPLKNTVKEVLEKNTDALIKKEVDAINKKVAENTEKNDSEENKDIDKKRSLIDVVNEQNKEKEAEAIAKNDTPNARWNVAPNVAPVYYSSLGNGSSLDPSFSDNPQNSDINISYGVNVAYHITDKLSVRSGVNNVNLSYSTSGLELGTGPVSAALKSINYGDRSSVVIAVDKGTLAAQPANPDGSGFGNIIPKSTSGEAAISQNISYYEVPLELKYALVDNRFGINMIGGFSTLFLGNNEVTVEAGNFSEFLGEANNLNSLSFTTNIGVGFDYSISKKLKFNIEPMFKYQLNPYSDSSVNYKPYFLGVYSGLSFKF